MEANRESCCFTGHRRVETALLSEVSAWLRREITLLADGGVSSFLNGGALGFDLLAAEEVLHLREEGLPIKLIMVLPCPEQAQSWPPGDAARYENILARADKVLYTGEEYTPGCMFVRNRYLAEHSAHCLCFLRPGVARGGTLYTVNYAARLGLDIRNFFDEPSL